jgi:hypothetical protein
VGSNPTKGTSGLYLTKEETMMQAIYVSKENFNRSIDIICTTVQMAPELISPVIKEIIDTRGSGQYIVFSYDHDGWTYFAADPTPFFKELKIIDIADYWLFVEPF